MEVPPEITYRGLDKNDEIEAFILEKAAKLDELHDRLISCRVAVEKDPEDQRSGSPYRVRVVVRVPPGKELIGRRESGEGETHEPLRVAVKDAFEAVRRQLIKLKEKQQGDVKTHPTQQLIGHVVRLFPEEGYGFIRSLEGREIFFHKNAVADDDFDRLEIGTGVRYFPTDSEKGPQASTVQIVDKPGSRVSKVDEPQVEPPEGWKE
ncbi:MAG: HPF/RaiA family ribosome-associated protein [Desulfobacterales bacterium]|nr:HPF/RaiA family ribosome-associated protein [Desulfobacterales bacterium]